METQRKRREAFKKAFPARAYAHKGGDANPAAEHNADFVRAIELLVRPHFEFRASFRLSITIRLFWMSISCKNILRVFLFFQPEMRIGFFF